MNTAGSGKQIYAAKKEDELKKKEIEVKKEVDPIK